MPDERWLYLPQAGLAALALVMLARHYTELTRQFDLAGGDLAVSAAVGVIVFIAWINMELPFLAWTAADGFNPTGPDGSLSLPLVLLRIAGATLVVPVMEELFWRSFLLRWFDRTDFTGLAPRAISNRALVYCAIPFGLEHNLWFAGVLAGIAYGWLYRRAGTLWAPITAHSLTNLLLGAWVLNTGNWRFW